MEPDPLQRHLNQHHLRRRPLQRQGAAAVGANLLLIALLILIPVLDVVNRRRRHHLRRRPLHHPQASATACAIGRLIAQTFHLFVVDVRSANSSHDTAVDVDTSSSCEACGGFRDERYSCE